MLCVWNSVRTMLSNGGSPPPTPECVESNCFTNGPMADDAAFGDVQKLTLKRQLTKTWEPCVGQPERRSTSVSANVELELEGMARGSRRTSTSCDTVPLPSPSRAPSSSSPAVRRKLENVCQNPLSLAAR